MLVIIPVPTTAEFSERIAPGHCCAVGGDWRPFFGGESIDREGESVGSILRFRTVVKREFVDQNSGGSFLARVEIETVGSSHTLFRGRSEAARIDAKIFADVIVNRRMTGADDYKSSVMIGSQSLHEEKFCAVCKVGHDRRATVRYGGSITVNYLAQREGAPAAEQIDNGSRSDFYRA